MTVEDVYGTPVQLWVTMKNEFGAESIFGCLFPYAMATLCVPATEAASERVFKAAKYAIHAEDRGWTVIAPSSKCWSDGLSQRGG